MLNISQLSSEKCLPCSSKTPKLSVHETKHYLALLKGWQIKKDQLKKEIKLKNFQEALSLANAIGEIAQKENHHPELYVSWGILRINIYTHAIKALSKNDFVLAAKI